jgi:hypothetical protein
MFFCSYSALGVSTDVLNDKKKVADSGRRVRGWLSG